MKSVYVFGPIHLFGESYLDFYKTITKFCSKHFEKVICTYPDFWETGESPEDFYKRTYDVITKLDLFIGEVSSPSSGVGMEFQMAQEHNIPCIALCKEGNKPSSMILGIPCLKQVVYYKELDDALEKLGEAIKEYSK